MNRRSSSYQVEGVRCAWRHVGWIALALWLSLLTGSALGQNMLAPGVLDAVHAVANGNATPYQQALTLKYHSAIQDASMAGQLGPSVSESDAVFKQFQSGFDAVNSQHLENAAKASGLKINTKPRGSDTTLPGTDTDAALSDPQGGKVTYEQWKRANDAYKRSIQDALDKNGLGDGPPPDTSTDILPDPNQTPPEDFKRITKEINDSGGTAYDSPEAARGQAAMDNGEPISMEQGRDMVHNYQNLAVEKLDKANFLQGQADKLRASDPAAAQALDMQAQLARSQAAKYAGRINKVGAKLAEQNGVYPEQPTGPAAEAADAAAKGRGAGTTAEAGTVGAMGEQILTKASQDYVKTLARIASENPQAAAQCEASIAEAILRLPLSQQGQAIENVGRIAGDLVAVNVAKNARNLRPPSGAGWGKYMGPAGLLVDGGMRGWNIITSKDPSKQAGQELGGFVGGTSFGLYYGAVGGLVGGLPGAVIGGIIGYGVGNYYGSPLGDTDSKWWDKNKPDSWFNSNALKAFGDPNKDIYGQLIAAGVPSDLAAKAAMAYKNGSLKEFNEIMTRIREQLTKKAKKMPTRRFKDMPTNEVQQLLDCLCSQSLGASPWVAQGYNTTIPADADPKIHSCGSLKNGPCMASMFGCWRSFIKWGNPGISDCLASFNLPTNSGQTLAEIDGAYQKPYEKPFKVEMKVEPSEVCPGDQVHVTMITEGGRGNNQYRYEVGWPLERPKDGPQNASTPTTASSMTFTVATPDWNFVDGSRWFESDIRTFATCDTFENGHDASTMIVNKAKVYLRPRAECEKLHPPLAAKKPPAKPPVKVVSKPAGVTSPDTTETLPPGDRVNVDDGSLPPPVTTTTATKPSTKGKSKTPKDVTATQPSPPPPPPSDHVVSQGPKGKSGVSHGDEGTTDHPVTSAGKSSVPPGTECSFGGGGTAIDNGPMNMWMEVPAGQRIRVTIKGSDGFTKIVEGVGRVDISRPRNPNGSDAITMENLDVPGCTQQQIAQYDTNGIPMGEPGGGLEQAEPTITDTVGEIGGEKADSGILDGFVNGHQDKGKEETDSGFKTISTSTKSSQKATSSDMDLASAAHVRDIGGADSQDTKNNTAKDTAKTDHDNSWNTALGNAIQQGFEQGAKDTASAFGTAAADGTSGAIFGNPTKDKDKNKGASTSDGGTQVASGSTSSSGASSGSGGVKGGRGNASGSSGQSSGCNTSCKTYVPPANQGNTSSNTIGGKGASVKGITMTCAFCGYTVTLPPGVQPDPNSHCPKCGCGADKGVVTCSVCGYRWLVDAATGPTGPCPNCGGKGHAVPDGSVEPGHLSGSSLSTPLTEDPNHVRGSTLIGTQPRPNTLSR